ncbi:MAG: hydrogenase maturation nickel metallochaperone HypA [Gemmatimonadota bacterium]
MHELSIAMSLVELATKAADDAGEDRPIEAVHIRVGALSGVVIDALEFCWDVATRDTACEGARLDVEAVPVRVSCPSCSRESALESPHAFRCAHCGTPTGEVTAGRELDLVSLEVADDAPTLPSHPEARHSTAHP